MQKKWTLNLAIVGQIIGMFAGTSQSNFYGLHNITDFAFLLGAGIPIAFIGGLIGLAFDYYFHRNNNSKVFVESEISNPNFKIILQCPRCKEKTRVPSNKELEIKCPSCSFVWIEKT